MRTHRTRAAHALRAVVITLFAVATLVAAPEASRAYEPQAQQAGKDEKERDVSFLIVLQSVGLSASSSTLRQIIWGGGTDGKGGTSRELPIVAPMP